jgi:lipopolysaccharide export system permease protein
MKILREYLLRTIVTTSGLVLLVLISLSGFIEFVGQLDDIGVGDYTIAKALVWVLLKLPTVIFQLLPVAVLLGALLGLGALASRSELVVMRASGVSPRDIGRAVLLAGLLLGVIGLLLGEYIAPPLERFARQYRAVAKHGQAGLIQGESAWIREGNIILNVRPPANDAPGSGVLVFRFDEQGGLAGIGQAESVRVEDGNQWYLNQYSESVFTPAAIEVRHADRSLAVAGINPDLLGLTVVREDTLSGAALYRYVQYLRRNGLDAHRYEVAFWARPATAVAVGFVCMLAVPFVLGPLRGGGAGSRMAAGLGIGLAWYLVSRTLVDGGEIWNLSPLLIAWLPTVLLALAASWALVRAR